MNLEIAIATEAADLAAKTGAPEVAEALRKAVDVFEGTRPTLGQIQREARTTLHPGWTRKLNALLAIVQNRYS